VLFPFQKVICLPKNCGKLAMERLGKEELLEESHFDLVFMLLLLPSFGLTGDVRIISGRRLSQWNLNRPFGGFIGDNSF